MQRLGVLSFAAFHDLNLAVGTLFYSMSAAGYLGLLLAVATGVEGFAASGGGGAVIIHEGTAEHSRRLAHYHTWKSSTSHTDALTLGVIEFVANYADAATWAEEEVDFQFQTTTPDWEKFADHVSTGGHTYQVTLTSSAHSVPRN